MADSSPTTPSSTTPILLSPADLPTRNPNLIYNFLTYHRLSSPYHAFVSTLSSVSVPQTVHEALSHLDWKHAIVEEMAALHSSGI